MLPVFLARSLTAAVISLACIGANALTPPEQANKDVVLAFYEAAINQKNFDAAAMFLGPKYIQHNQRSLDGVEGLKGFVDGYLKRANPALRAIVKRVVVQDDLVVLHVHSLPEPDALGSAIVDIFRVENGKIVEHWDVMQPVPDKPANGNTMF